MKIVAKLALLLTVTVMPLVGAAREPSRAILESSVETTGRGAHLPDTPDGKIMLIGCDHCVERSLQLQAGTRFTLNGAPVTLAQLRRAAAGAGDKNLTIHYTLADRLVTRVDLVSF